MKGESGPECVICKTVSLFLVFHLATVVEALCFLWSGASNMDAWEGGVDWGPYKLLVFFYFGHRTYLR